MTPHAHAASHEHGPETGPGGLVELLDLDAEVLHGYLTDVTSWVAAAAGRPVRTVLDVGAGTGTGTFALLERFAGSEVVALDVAEQMLDHLQGKADRLGLADRVRTVQADLDGDWPGLAPVDLAWAASSLHHMADPDRALSRIRDLLRPGGLLAVTEMSSFPLFLPDDVGLGEPGLEARCQVLHAEARAEHVPHQGADWGVWLSRAGFTVEADRVFEVELTAPLPAVARRYAQLSLRQMRTGLAGRVGPEDQAVLDVLLDEHRPESVLRRPDLTVRATRFGWLARRA
jgi:SAM-dependent methyltransferase